MRWWTVAAASSSSATSASILQDLDGSSHDSVIGGLAELGRLLGLGVQVPKAKQGEHDLQWELSNPGRRLVFEVKLAPRANCTAIKDVNQAEGAVRAVEAAPGVTPVRGLLVTPHEAIEPEAAARLERVRLVRLTDLRAFAQQLLDLLARYADGWSEDARARERARKLVEGQLPDLEAALEAQEEIREQPVGRLLTARRSLMPVERCRCGSPLGLRFWSQTLVATLAWPVCRVRGKYRREFHQRPSRAGH